MKTRIISGVIASALLVGVLALLPVFPPILHIMVAVISSIAAYEITGATGLSSVKLFTAISMLTAAVLSLVSLTEEVQLWSEVVVVLYIFAMLAIQLKVHRSVKIPDVLLTVAVVLLTTLSLRQLTQVYDMGGTHGIFYVLMLLLSAWASDTGAYFIGVRFGRHKLCPEISPKKSVEGFVGGIAGSVIILEAVTALYTMVIIPGTAFSWVAVALIAICCSVISVLGDLSFSLVKRHYGIKDYGNIMPGHGGVLDRFDSVIFVAPIFTLILHFLPIVHA